jgi:hypothetical protein
MKVSPDDIISFYSGRVPSKPPFDKEAIEALKETNLATRNPGIGDAVVLTSLARKDSSLHIFSNNVYWPTMCVFNSVVSPVIKDNVNYIITESLEFFNLGGGHLSQRFQRAFGQEVSLVPQGVFDRIIPKIIPKRIGICLGVGQSANDLIPRGFERPRQLYQENLSVIEDFINCTDFEFIEFGSERKTRSAKVNNYTGATIYGSIGILSTCDYFIGLNSGFMNLAAALGIKSIIIINVPKAEDFCLPYLIDTHVEDMNWLYPQNIHLHQDGENKFCAKLTLDNLKAAINGDIYPYFSNDYLNLVHE